MKKQQHTVRIFNKHVKAYKDKFMDLNLYKDTFDDLLRIIPSGGSILELGCGPGNVVRYMKANRPDLHVIGIDLAPQMIEAAQKANPNAVFKLLDIRHISEIKDPLYAVLATFSIPYLALEDLAEMISNMRRLTDTTKGVIYVSCMEGPREKSGFERTSFSGEAEIYIEYYPRYLIESLIKTHDFVIKKFYAKEYVETDGSITIDLIYIAERCNAS